MSVATTGPINYRHAAMAAHFRIVLPCYSNGICYADDAFGKPTVCFEEPKRTGLLGPPITYDGTPFVVTSSVIMECQFGRDHHKARNEKAKQKSYEV